MTNEKTGRKTAQAIGLVIEAGKALSYGDLVLYMQSDPNLHKKCSFLLSNSFSRDNIHYEYQRREMISHIWTGHEVFSRTDPKLQFYLIFQIVVTYIIRLVLRAR